MQDPRFKAKPNQDLGFGQQPTQNNQRMMNKDGSSNLKRKGLPFFKPHEAYNSLIYMSWYRFWVIILTVYFLINTLFASIYLCLGKQALAGSKAKNNFEQFFDGFFFSAQTISTVGYGHLSPSGMAASGVAAFESLLGLLAFAMATGLLYGRFSRPNSKITYSHNMLVSPYKNTEALMLRLANYRSNQLLDVEAELYLAYNLVIENNKTRQFLKLNLERDKVAILATSWTIVHPITDDSPILDLTLQQLKDSDAEFLVIIKSFDDAFAQVVHSRTSYKASEIVYGAKFISMTSTHENGLIEFDVSKIGEFYLI
ncbi:MAG: ion transporter [Sphingobacteriales bacterium]|nr:MAG: ion transporter [Sphingobacteriales bacterium]TAF83934.1 MAG: ion transporter [Sphingobacteriales bacterium]